MFMTGRTMVVVAVCSAEDADEVAREEAEAGGREVIILMGSTPFGRRGAPFVAEVTAEALLRATTVGLMTRRGRISDAAGTVMG